MPGGVLARDLGFKEKPYNRKAPQGDTTLLYVNELQNSPGKSIVGIRVELPGGAETPPHTHGGAFVTVVVIEGQMLNKMDDNPLMVFKAGESFFEHTCCHHVVSANVSKTEKAVLLATLIVETETAKGGMNALFVIDKEYC
ncbi:cupin domain protein [Calycina marina]|uniref:Cupin domain protein n=1 Tax=Calycina marina TaxID=1763456 RepID=A0A9P7YYD6_9HELO|nr:cupin domain protein [Calycina marina]